MNIRELGIEEVTLTSPTPLEELKENLSSYGITLKTLVKKRLVVPDILSTIKKEEITLIVAHLDRTSRKPLRGSIAKSLIKKSFIPVLIVNQGKENKEIANGEIFKHVVFATNWSPESEMALNFLLNIKESIKELEIVNVISKKLTIRDIRNLKEKLIETRKTCLDQGIDAEFHIYAGKTSEEIITAASDYKATAIVMGTRHKPTISELFLGNSSTQVAEVAPIYTLVIP